MRKKGDPRKKGTRLSENEQRYCHLRADPTIPKRRAYVQAFQTNNLESANVLSRHLEARPEVKAEIKRLRALTETELTLQRQAKREFLAKIVRGNLLTMSDEEYAEIGEEFGLGKRRLNKLEAIRLDNQMAGHDRPEGIEPTMRAAVMILPASQSLDEWEARAVEHQEKMCNDL